MFPRFLIPTLSIMASLPVWAAAPLIDNPVPLATEAARVANEIPVGKTLLFPITATDPDGDVLSYTVTSSNVNIMVRAKTGNPTLNLAVEHAAGTAEDPAYSGTMQFMLLRDWLPVTSNFVAGFAQSGFYDNRLFHRIADLGGGQGTTGFIYQGGDPLGSGGGGPGMTGTNTETAWKFQNEFHVGTIFSGRGQLAMANAGTSTGYSLGAGGTLIVPDYLDTNGSQFFITDGQPRHLDFKHNIFGQMLRGWELLPKLRTTATSSSRPVKDLKITAASVVPNTSDAVLVLSAKAVGTAKITVTARDPGGAVSTKTFTVTAVPDESNSNPFYRRISGQNTPKDTPAVFGLEAVDLEFDYLDLQHSMLPLSASLGPKGSLLAQSGRVVQMQPNAGYVGSISMGFSLRQYSLSEGRFESLTDYTNVLVGAGDHGARGEAATIHAVPGVALVNTVAGKLRDMDPAGRPSDFTAKINWGDGTPLATGSILAETGSPGSSVYAALGGHTYARAGVYPVVVEFVGNAGTRATARSTAIVSAEPVRMAGEEFEIAGPRVVNRTVATFSDTSPTLPADYTATINWGDGGVSSGTITRDVRSGRYLVSGTHGYRDSEPYTVSVLLDKKNTLPKVDASAWSRIFPRFAATAPHLPPFPHPKLTIAWNSGPTKRRLGNPGADYQVFYDGVFVIINTGNREIKASKLRFWLSEDRDLNLSGPGKDTPLTINGEPLLNIIPFPAGAGGSGNFTVTLPKGESSGRKFLLAEAVYSNPIADADGTEKIIVTGPLPPTILIGTPAGAPLAIASLAAGSVITVNTTGPHGLITGDKVNISGVMGGLPTLAGVFAATVVDFNTFTIPRVATTVGTGGIVTPTSGTPSTSESGRTASFTVLLDSPPKKEAAIGTMVAGNPAKINTATAHGLETGDSVIISGVAGGTTGLNAAFVATVVDSDTFTVPFDLIAAGTGGKVAGPARVRIPLESSLPAEATVSPAELVFTATNWNLPQTVTVTGVDDSAVDGLKTYAIRLKAALSADSLFSGLVGGEVALRNADNDAPAP